MHRIVSFLPAATEIAAGLGLMDQVVGVSHECDFPDETNHRPRVTRCPVHDSNLASREVESLADIFDDIQRVAERCDVPERAGKLIGDLSARVENVRKRAETIPDRRRCFLMEWVDPPFCSGHWGPELVEIAGGCDSLGRKHQPSAQIEWQ